MDSDSEEEEHPFQDIPAHDLGSWYATPFADERKVVHVDTGTIIRREGDQIHVIPKDRNSGTKFFCKGPKARIHLLLLWKHASKRLKKTIEETKSLLGHLIKD